MTEVKLGQPANEKDPSDIIIPIATSPTKTPEEDGVSKKAKEAISFLKERQEFWSQFKPMYSTSRKGPDTVRSLSAGRRAQSPSPIISNLQFLN